MTLARPGRQLYFYFRFFYDRLGRAVFVALLASLVVAVMDGFGIAMFLPLLHAATGTGSGQALQAGELGVIFDRLIGIGLDPSLLTILSVMLLLFVLKGLARFGLLYYRAVLQKRFASTLRLNNLQLLAGADYGKFSERHAGTIQNAFGTEMIRLNQAYHNYFQFLQYLIMALVYSVLAYAANPKFALVVIVGGVLANLSFNRINRATKKASAEISRGMNDFQDLLISSVASFKFLKATGLMTPYSEKVARTIADTEHQHFRIGVLNAFTTAVREPLVVLAVVIAIGIQVLLFRDPLGLIVLSLLFFYRALTAVTAVQTYYNEFLGLSGAINNVAALEREIGSEQESPGTIPFNGLQRSIAIAGLNFAYGPDRVLSDLSLELSRYETLGVVGQSGSGKTTLVNLLCLLQTPGRGMVRVDGHDINDLNKQQYRAHLGYVTQETYVFNDTVRNNVTFWQGKDHKTDLAVWEALRLAHAADFVEALPDGLDTRLGINGMALSGGQRQRLAIARELYRGVDLLILDEATSALDSRSEQLIQENIDFLSGSLTMIVIAHRLSTIRKADKVLFLQPGGVYEIGTFEDLLRSSLPFRKMVTLQAV